MAFDAYSTHAPSSAASTPRKSELRQRAEAAIERLIMLLDAIDGDPDFEPGDPLEPEHYGGCEPAFLMDQREGEWIGERRL